MRTVRLPAAGPDPTNPRELVDFFALYHGLRFLDRTMPISLALSLAAGADGRLEMYGATGILPGGLRGTVAQLLSSVPGSEEAGPAIEVARMSVVLIGFKAWPLGTRVVRCRGRDGALLTPAPGGTSDSELQHQIGAQWKSSHSHGLRLARRFALSASVDGAAIAKELSSPPLRDLLRDAPRSVSFELLGTELCVNQAHRLHGSAAGLPQPSMKGLAELAGFGVRLANELDKIARQSPAKRGSLQG